MIKRLLSISIKSVSYTHLSSIYIFPGVVDCVVGLEVFQHFNDMGMVQLTQVDVYKRQVYLRLVLRSVSKQMAASFTLPVFR